MSCYEALAAYYDRLTADVDYRGFADRYAGSLLRNGKHEPRNVPARL